MVVENSLAVLAKVLVLGNAAEAESRAPSKNLGFKKTESDWVPTPFSCSEAGQRAARAIAPKQVPHVAPSAPTQRRTASVAAAAVQQVGCVTNPLIDSTTAPALFEAFRAPAPGGGPAAVSAMVAKDKAILSAVGNPDIIALVTKKVAGPRGETNELVERVARDLCPVPAARSGQAEAAEAISIAQAIVAGVLAAADRYFSETQKDIILNAIPAGYRPSLEGNDPRRSKVVVPSNSGDPHPDLTKATILAGLGKQPGAFRVVNAGSDDTGVLLSIIPGNLSKDRLLDYLQLVRGVPPEKVVVYADGGLQTKALLRGRVATVSSSADAVNINLIASARSDYAAVATSDTALMTRGASGKLDPNAAEMLYQLLLAGKSVAITTELGERDLRLMVSDLKDWVTTAKKSPALTPEQYSNLIFGTTGSAVITDATKIAPDITGTPRVGA